MVCMKWKSGTNRKYRKRGMLTVEASLLIPLAVLSVGIMISLSIFSYQRCWYTQAGCETVLAGSTQEVLKNSSGREKAEARWNVLQDRTHTGRNIRRYTGMGKKWNSYGNISISESGAAGKIYSKDSCFNRMKGEDMIGCRIQERFSE